MATNPLLEAAQRRDAQAAARAQPGRSRQTNPLVEAAGLSGGMVRGPGTGTSDSIPARLSHGEYVLPADTVAAVGQGALDQLRAATHTPVQRYADGGLVDDPGAVTRVGNSYSGMDVRGNVTINGQAPGGTFNENPGMRSTPMAAGMASAGIGAASSPSAAAAPAPGTAASNPGLTPSSPTDWIGRNAQRSLEVTASSIMPSRARDDAQAQLGLTAKPPGAPSQGDDLMAPDAPGLPGRRPMPSFGSPAVPSRPAFGTQQPRGYADGGLVEDERRRAALINQIPTDGQRQAPLADGSQSNPLNNELGRNVLNTLSALPGVAGVGARVGSTAARGVAGSGGALSAERVIPAAWEVVQDGGALARAAPEGGPLARAAGSATQQQALAANSAPMLRGPSSNPLVQRAFSEIGEAAPQMARVSRGPVPWADVVQPAALAGPQAGQVASMAHSSNPLVRLAAAGAGAAGLAGAVSGDTAQGETGAAGAPQQSVTRYSNPLVAAALEQGGSVGAGPTSGLAAVTRDGNSYSGPANIRGDISVNGATPGGSVSSVPAGNPLLEAAGITRGGGVGGYGSVMGNPLVARALGGVSEQNMAAADALAQRQQAESLARLGLGQAAVAQPGFTGVIGQSSGNGNMWSRTPEQQRRDAEVSASSIHAPTAARGAAALESLDRQDLQQVRNQGEMSVAGLQGRNALSRTLLENQGAMDRQALQTAGTVQAAQLRSAATGGKAPAGYRYTTTGALEAIPGGPAALKNAEEQKTKDAALDGSRQAIGTINRLLSSPGREGATGTWNLSRHIPGNASADFAAEVETLKAQTFLPMVQQLRGMGALSNAEGDKLNAAVGALNFNMSEQAFAESLGRIRDQIASAMQRSGVDIKDVSNWGLAAPSSTTEQPALAPGGQAQTAVPAQSTPAVQQVSTREAYAALPSGARFIGPDGSERIKP